MEHESGQLRGKILVADARLYGLAKSRFLSVKPEMDGDFFRLEIDVEIPKILIDGDYKAEGSLGTFKMGGKGMCERWTNDKPEEIFNFSINLSNTKLLLLLLFYTTKKRSKIEEKNLRNHNIFPPIINKIIQFFRIIISTTNNNTPPTYTHVTQDSSTSAWRTSEALGTFRAT